MSSAILVPVADHGGSLVWASELAAAGARPDGLTCVGCGGDLVLRAGERNQPHFAHRHSPQCPNGETALHAATCRVLAEALTAASRDGRTFPIFSSCQQCRASRTGNLAALGLEVAVDEVLADRIRPDLLARAGGRELFVVEVVVTHAPEEAALQLYASRDLPTVLVRPTWDTLARFRGGFNKQLQQTSAGEPGSYEIVSRCRFPRHVSRSDVKCPDCQDPARALTAEVSILPCWSSGCANDTVKVLDLYDHSRGFPQLVAASCPDLPSLGELAASLGVRLTWRHSKQAMGSYLMHQCGRCRAPQGDNFVYGEEPTPDLVTEVVHLTACRRGHLHEAERRRWPAEAHAQRVLPPNSFHGVIGLVGERPGLFDQPHETQLATVTRVDPQDLEAITRRMLGLDRM